MTTPTRERELSRLIVLRFGRGGTRPGPPLSKPLSVEVRDLGNRLLAEEIVVVADVRGGL